MVQTCDFNSIKISKSGTFPFNYEDFLTMAHIVQTTKGNQFRDCNDNKCQANVITSQKYKIVLLGDSTAYTSSVSFTLALREVNI